jgi:hypothetical protein
MLRSVQPLSGLSLVLALVFGGTAAADGDLVASRPLGAGAAIRIVLDRGSVDVHTHDLDVARFEARARGLGASAVHFELVGEDDDLLLTGGAESWLSWMSYGPRVSVQVWVPRSCQLEILTAGGDVRVNGVDLGIIARTSGGDVEVAFPAEAGADLDARNRTSPDPVAGAINGGGTLRLRASGASIHVRAP